LAIKLRELNEAANRFRQRLVKSATEARVHGLKTAFLCHSHENGLLAKGLVQLLGETGWEVYIDWQDTSMPTVPSRETALKIQKRIKSADYFLFLATPNPLDSRWGPWEIGYANGAKPIDTILVVTTSGVSGVEYGYPAFAALICVLRTVPAIRTHLGFDGPSKRLDEILQACLEELKSSGRTSDQQIAEFIVYRRCNVSKLTPERIAALKDERDALAEFRVQLEQLAQTLPPNIHSEPHLEIRLNDLTNDMFKRWKADQANLSSYARELFGVGVLAAPEKLVAKLVEAAVTPYTGVGTALGGTAGAHLGNLTLGLTTGAAAGFAIAVVFRAVETWGKVKKLQKDSPFRYLTTLERNGVVFSLSK
jgi:hypothetical protein